MITTMRYLITFIFIAGIAGLSGCGKKEIPPPPVTHTLLVKKLFDNIIRHQHKAAVKRIQKVRALDPSNEFLIQLEEREFCNYYIQQAQKLLDAGEITQTLAIITPAVKKYPLNRNLLAIQTELKQLKKLQQHIRLLNSAVSSREMNSQINAIALFIRNYPSSKILRPLLRKKILLAFKMKLHEQERARFDLLCDLETVRRAKNVDRNLNDALLAVLSVANAATVNKNERVKADLLD